MLPLSVSGATSATWSLPLTLLKNTIAEMLHFPGAESWPQLKKYGLRGRTEDGRYTLKCRDLWNDYTTCFRELDSRRALQLVP